MYTDTLMTHYTSIHTHALSLALIRQKCRLPSPPTTAKRMKGCLNDLHRHQQPHQARRKH